MSSYGSQESPPGNVMEKVVGKQVASPVASGLGYGCCAGMALFLASRATLTLCSQSGTGGGWASGPFASWHSGLQTSGITGSVAMAGVFSAPTAPLIPSSLSLLQAEGRESQTSFSSNKVHSAFLIQVASKGRLLLWGAKVNSLIEAGQIWRLITPAVLHANVGHLLVNCYSLNSVGPVVEELGGARRFLAVYTVSALAGTLASYRMCTSPSVGASGAIFGLVGALAVFFARHRRLLGNSGSQNLQSISRVIVLNMVGGLLGGAATAWVVGPALVFQTPRGGGRRQLVDRPPYKLLFRSNDSTS
ncbi:hypothetical protein CBR_g30610 [Chara braunii]|uniref:Peptidase S54 rhomboid domain-containing protein n=1 Tax=Chara braunii TaxID=69332 RepID=A0A388LD56_CHABU|nr:hypothetical protein CBR_g30610 [Chara braunii]|eukprot:GBG80245.1 hypothetical protein CBR_g30610 [Chara braunii]